MSKAQSTMRTWLVGAAAVATLAVAAGAQRIEIQGTSVRIADLGDGGPLGAIAHVVANPRGGALILGGPTKQGIALVDANGARAIAPTTLAALGAPLSWPVGATFDGPTSIAVIDAGSPRFARLTLIAGRFKVDTMAMTELSGVSAICSLSGRRFVLGRAGPPPSKGLVHEISPAGVVLNSFGRSFGGLDNPGIEHGHILCLRSQQSIVMTSRLFPELRAYTASGKEIWSRELPSFKGIHLEIEGKLMRFVMPADSLFDETLAVFSPDPSVIAVQIGRRRGRTSDRPVEQIRTLFLTATSGEVVGSQLDLPVVMAASTSKLYTAAKGKLGGLEVHSFTYRMP